jgi:hypothetical protein
MNTLFIGPYQQTDYIGNISKCYLDYLLSSSKHQEQLVCRPLYLDNETTSDAVFNSNNERLTSTKTIIQNVPIEMFVGYTKFSNNILIPIINHKKEINIKFRDNLQLANKILVNNHTDYNKLIQCNLDPKKISLFSIKAKIDNSFVNKKIDLGIYDLMYKFYFIGEYKSNTDIIQKLITSFVHSFRNKENVCLVLWISSSENDRVQLLKFYEEVKNKLQIKNGIEPVVFISRPINFSETLLIHASGDTYLAINDDYYPVIDEYYSGIYQKQLINRSILDTIKMPDIYESNYELDNYYKSITIESLSEQMLKKFGQSSNSSHGNNKHSKNKIDLLSLI